MQTEHSSDRTGISSVGIVRIGGPAKERLWIVLVALSFLWAMSASALTRIEALPNGIPGSGGALGSAVALSGDTAAVGAPDSHPAPLIGIGSVDIFRHVGADWLREAILLAAAPVGEQRFGAQVELGPDLLVTTTTDAFRTTQPIYTFARAGSSWQQVDRFAASATISLSASTLALGNGSILIRAGTGWSPQAQLVADGAEYFNSTVVDGDFVLAYTSDFISNFEIHNYVYLFHRTGSSWVREARIELGDSSIFYADTSAFALSQQSALISWHNVVTALARDADGTWVSQGGLDPLTSAPGFGAAVAIDGERALVSSPDDTVFGWGSAGTVYVFERSNGVWTRKGHVAHSTVNYYDYEFGTSVALEGDTMLVGAPGAYTEGPTGDATILSHDGGNWTPVATLDPGNDRRGEGFGNAVALSGSTLLAGAGNAPTSSPFVNGAAYLFDATDSGWIERVRLAPSPPSGNGFGGSVSIDQDTAVVGAAEDDGGAVHVFVRGDGTWPQQARLVGGGSGDAPTAFGAVVAIQGDVLAAGEPGNPSAPGEGKVRVFERTGTAWSPQAIVQAADGSVANGFGSAMALAGNTLVVGAPGADVGIETDGGAVYVFTSSGGVWSQQAKVTAPIAAKLAGFGKSVALSGNTLVVGAVDATSTRGAAYVYTSGNGVWTLHDRLLPAGPVSGSYGGSVAISGSADRILVGQPVGTFDDPNGRVFVFGRTDSGWTPLPGLAGTTAPPATSGGDGFGRSVAMAGETAVVGGPGDGLGGAAYVADVGDALFGNGFEGE